MAEHRQRGNKEARKPKKNKTLVAATAPLGSQVKLAGTAKQSLNRKI